MPTVLRTGPYRFHFYSDEGKEPPHIHIETPDGECKFWLDPIRLARNKGVPPSILRQIEKLVFANSELLKDKFYEHFGDRKRND
ncbi:MAG: DUF4160 domain-containing protein [Deltaproteobacteria bacterium]|nr:DUF4160 domain-containing protein [Deltaproteobacteria bacterium]